VAAGGEGEGRPSWRRQRPRRVVGCGILRSVRPRLSYANVVASLALFIALGGVSYAVVELPAGSVGSAQLRDGAVLPRALGFPLHAASVTDNKVEDDVQGYCNTFPRPPDRPQCKEPLRLGPGGPTPGREVRLHLRTRGQLLVSAIISLAKRGPPSSSVSLEIGIVLDQQRGEAAVAGRRVVSINGGEQMQVPLQALIHVSPGSRTIGVYTGFPAFGGEGSGDLLVAPISLIVNALPG
jgi:hypothetical protein